LVADGVRTLSLIRVEQAVQVFDGHGVLQAIPLVLINSACPEPPDAAAVVVCAIGG